MIMNLQEYKEKVRGCWIGKNIGGTLGAPFECRRGVFNVDFYTQELNGEPLPNDDLDLQLVWLNAAEKYGKAVEARILGEYWHSFIVPNWGEYGAGKNNMRMGIVPPLSGYVNNAFRDSNGACIRSEIWACLAPGHPEIAVKYAYEDAIVDHSHEGVYAEVFFAAIQSAAFSEKDVYRLIDIGLSYIPADCGVARGARIAIESYRSGLTWQEARIRMLQGVPGSFGALCTPVEEIPAETPVGEMGWDAPSNVGITLIGWLYGEGDFGESVCIATNCGEDTDCAAATVGAILGIIHGESGIPEKWKAPIGDNIKTCCLNITENGIKYPKTVTELTDRVLRLAPTFLGSEWCDVLNPTEGYTVQMNEESRLFETPVYVNAWVSRSFADKLAQSPFTVHYDFVIFSAQLAYDGEPFAREGEQKTFKLVLENQIYVQQWIEVVWHVPAGWKVGPSAKTRHSLEQYHCNIGRKEIEFTVLPETLTDSRHDILIEIRSQGRHTKGIIPVVLIS